MNRKVGLNILRRYFRLLIGVYVIVIITQFIAAEFARPMIPDYVADWAPSFYASTFLTLSVSLLCVFAVLLLTVVAIVGLYCLWPPAKSIFMVAVVLKIVGLPLIYRWDVLTGVEMMLGSLGMLIEGVIITEYAHGTVRHLFRKTGRLRPLHNKLYE